jgi:uncharacterized protein
MRCGVNLTSPKVLPEIRELLRDGSADFCEILIDNFLHLCPKEMRVAIGDVPVGFHIMWSRYLERDSNFPSPSKSSFKARVANSSRFAIWIR